MRLLYNIFIWSLLSSLGMCGTIDPDNADIKYIQYGKKFECVGKLCGKDNANQYYCASAVAIRPKWILTAAHVVKPLIACQISINNKKIQVKKIIPHKEFKYENFGEYDIALCLCSEDIGLNEYPKLYTNTDEIGKQCSISGYGLHGTFLTGCKNFDNEKRAGMNIIDGSEKHILICSPSKNENKTSLEFLIASGDSGGGLFIGSELAGINSCVMASDKTPDSSYNDEGCHTRISLFAEWMDSVILDNKEE